jgi:hypothetical protein
MSDILYLQPIFAPDQKRAYRNINSIQSMGDYIRANGTNGHNLTIVMGGWAATDDLWNQIVSACKQFIAPDFTPIRIDKNYGKALVVNKLIKVVNEQKTPYDYLLTADSDILFQPDTKNMFGRLVIASQQCEIKKGRPFGLLALNQKGAGCHYQSCYQNAITYNLNGDDGSMLIEKIVWPQSPSGIAGGCLFLSRKMWESVGGYRVMGVYAGDDAYLLLDCYQRGFCYQMADTIAIVHPPEDDEEYAKWKVATCQRDSSTGTKSDIRVQLKEAEDFWNNRKK